MSRTTHEAVTRGSSEASGLPAMRTYRSVTVTPTKKRSGHSQANPLALCGKLETDNITPINLMPGMMRKRQHDGMRPDTLMPERAVIIIGGTQAMPALASAWTQRDMGEIRSTIPLRSLSPTTRTWMMRRPHIATGGSFQKRKSAAIPTGPWTIYTLQQKKCRSY